MRLVSLDIVNLRSIEAQRLDECGNFNVLIGKNNSGKSNLLSAVASFFSFLSGGNLAEKDPIFGKSADFFNKDDARPIGLRGKIQVGSEVLSGVYERIAEEFPQVKQAIPAVGECDVLCIDIEYLTKPFRTGYIKTISHQPCEKDGSPSGEPISLVSVPFVTAKDLASRIIQIKTMSDDASVLENRPMDNDEWVMFKRGRSLPSYSYGNLSKETLDEVTSMALRSDDLIEFSRQVQSYVIQLRARVSDLESKKLENAVDAFAGEIDSVPNYVKYLVAKLAEIRVLHLADRREPIGSIEAGQLLRLKMSRGGGQTLRNIQETVSSLLGVEIDAFASDTPRRPRPMGSRRIANLPDAELDVDDFLVQANGSGIREALRLVLDLEFQQPDLLLVEEPEVHLHPALEVAMMRYLKGVSYSTQVFLTTHSTNFLDTGDLRNIYMVQKGVNTQVKRLNVDDVDIEVSKELGIRLSSVFMFDRLIFVEGVSDELVLRAFAHTLGINLGQANVGFVVMGGARNFTHYAAQATLSFLGKRQVKSFFVIDRDEKQEVQIDRLVAQLEGQAELHVLTRREIENYLLVPGSIASFIKEKSWRSAKREILVDPSTVLQRLPEVADGLQSTSILKRLASQLCQVYRIDRNRLFEESSESSLADAAQLVVKDLEAAISDLRREIPELVSRAQDEVTSNWDGLKLEMAPGHEILDELMKDHGLRFNKDRDSGHLAALVPVEEVASEIESLLRKVTQ
ncbi:AAA family ATPase [Amycolatopsis sp. VS8301801F10]|uniref:AAA family ATPase n=1 Tax=Amycolatopsis sp. VS8301801F10 TaxID=2652442 RepID=UPI0038FCED9A